MNNVRANVQQPLHSASFLENRIQERTVAGLLRSLPSVACKIDFCSNDYLGFAQNEDLRESVLNRLQLYPQPLLGSSGSRLISGNHAFAEKLESKIAAFHGAESALLFNTGYQANLGIFSSVAYEADTLITDEYVHASIIDGVRLSKARRFIFRHNDLNDLESKLKRASGQVFIGVEALYSMEGDFAPLREICELAKTYGAHVIVDEAHSTGITGAAGKGFVCEYGLENEVFARIVTFGKALGSQGAVILGSEVLRHYLINFARSFIFTTALPPASLIGIDAAYDFLIEHESLLQVLKANIDYFSQRTQAVSNWHILPRSSCIQIIRSDRADAVVKLSATLWEAGIWAKAILPPTVPAGRESVRLILHSFNTFHEIDLLFSVLEKMS